MNWINSSIVLTVTTFRLRQIHDFLIYFLNRAHTGRMTFKGSIQARTRTCWLTSLTALRTMRIRLFRTVRSPKCCVLSFSFLFFSHAPRLPTTWPARSQGKRERERVRRWQQVSHDLSRYKETKQSSRFSREYRSTSTHFCLWFSSKSDQAAGVNCKVQQNTDPSELTRSRQLYRVYQTVPGQ